VSGIVSAVEYENEWIKVTADSNSAMYMNGTRIKAVENSNDKEVEIWAKMVVTANHGNSKVGYFTLAKQRIRCTDHYSKILQLISYNNKKNVLSDNKYNFEYEEAVPDSRLEKVSKIACYAVFEN